MNSPSEKRHSGGTRVLNEHASVLNVVDVTDVASSSLHQLFEYCCAGSKNGHEQFPTVWF